MLYILLITLSYFFSTALLAQTCRNNIAHSTPPGTFQDNGNGTVTDIRHNLVWKRCAEGQTWDGATCTGTAATYTWDQSLAIASNANFAGRSDWRLPNLKELTSIVEEACFDPSIDIIAFPNTPSNYFWSASPYAYNADDAWVVHFSNGNDYGYGYGRSSSGHARLVCVRQ